MTECAVVDARGGRHAVRNRLHQWAWERDDSKIEVPLSAAGALTTGRVGCAEARLMSARGVADIVLPILRGGPLYLLSRDARESYSDSGCPR